MSWANIKRITGLDSSEFVHDILKLKKQQKMKQEIYERVTNEPEFKDQKLELHNGMEKLQQKIAQIKSMDLKTAAKHWDDVHTFVDTTTVLLWLLILVFHVCRIIIVVLLPELFLECVLDEGAFERSQFGTNFHLSWTMLFGEYPCVPIYCSQAE